MNATLKHSAVHQCPSCKGTGKMSIQVHEGGTVTESKLRCIDCNGEGKVSDETIRLIQRMKDAWCRCPQEDQIPQFFYRAPGFLSHVGCQTCGKLLQVG